MLTLALLLQVVNSAAFLSASRLVQEDLPAALSLATQLLRFYLVVIIPVFLLVAFHAGGVLTLLFGEGYAIAADVLIILLAALPFLVISSSLQLLLMALPRPTAVLAARVAGAAVLLALGVLLIPRMGATGAALALAAGEAVNTALLFLFVVRATGGVPWDRRCFAPLAAGASAALVYTVAQAWPFCLKLPLAAAIYLCLVVVLAGVNLHEIRAVPSLLLGVARGEGSPQQRPQQRPQDAGVKPGAEDLEAATAFEVLPPWPAAAVLLGFTGGGLFVAWRGGQSAIAWIAVSACLLVGVGLLFATRSPGPAFTTLLLTAVGATWVAYRHEWTGQPWLGAAFVDVLIAAMTVAMVAEPPPWLGQDVVIGAQLGLVGLFVGTFAVRHLALERPVWVFDAVQLMVAFALGFEGAAQLGAQGGARVVFGAGALGDRIWFMDRRESPVFW